MKLYRISQTANSNLDTYDSAIVCAKDEEEARYINPDCGWDEYPMAWCKSPDQVTVELIGIAVPGVPPGIVLERYNAS
jgi:hypothetical protein